MKNTMNLNKAFTVRNRLKSYVSELCDKLDNAPNFFDDQEKLNKYISENDTSENLIADYMKGTIMLANFKTSIENANIKAKEILFAINVNKQHISIISSTLNRIKNDQRRGGDRTTEIVDGVRQLSDTYKISYFDIESLNNLLTTFKKQVNELEDELSVINSSTMVDVSQDVVDYINEVLY